MLYRYLFLLFVVLIAGCSSHRVEDNQAFDVLLDPRVFFDGKICADGVVRDRNGMQIRQFNAEIIASWDEQGRGLLDETFHFNDGIEYRKWWLTPVTNAAGVVDGYQARASDVPEATLMTFSGNAIYMDYQLQYQTGVDSQGEAETLGLSMIDRMYQVAPGVVINETRMEKFGLGVGQVLLVMRKVGSDVNCVP
ncbi:MAG: DUF3833 domain-containing protein [Saccharospirillaceae bacterium]|jgi:hypothetical protein|nr:DUF3833 domain-containing protein [Saccharospirillaceae bacterium]